MKNIYYTLNMDESNFVPESETIYKIQVPWNLPEDKIFERLLNEAAPCVGLCKDKMKVVQTWGFNDCWIKSWSSTYKEIKETIKLFCEPFSPAHLAIAKPGSHPGGNAYWISPTVPIYGFECNFEDEE